MTHPSRTALITGAGQRIGRAVAGDLAAAGWDIAIHYNASRSEAEAIAAEIAAAGRKARAFGADFRDAAAADGLLDAAARAMGPVTALINCASIFEPDEATDFSDDGWDRHMDVNLKAPLLLTKSFARQLPAGAKGAVINFVDQRVLKPTPHFFTYTLSKLALWQATRTLAQSLAPAIRVNAIAPGPTLRNARQSDADFAAQCAATPLATGSPLAEICRGVRYLLDAEAVTGQTLTIDGGQHLIWQTPDIVGIQE